jgi:hypothetical protein
MVSDLIFSSIIVSILILIIMIGFGFSIFARTKKTSLFFDIFIFVLMLVMLVMIVLIYFFYPRTTQTPSPSPEPQPIQPSPIMPSPFTSVSQMPKYFQYDPTSKNLKRLSFDKITDGKEIVDYFHKNDESLFVLSDGTIVSIFGQRIDRYPTNPPMQKVRVSKGNYVGLSNGNIYFSKDLKNWTKDTSYSNIINFDVPSNQTNILYLQTPNENILFDLNTMNSTKEPSSKKAYGSTQNSFLRFTNDGIFINDQMLYRDSRLGNVDSTDKFYIVPDKIQSKYKIRDIFATDNKAILKLEGDTSVPDQYFIGDELIYR